ncbi:YiiD C-terminal domain-containing protein [Pirellulales bacterium]|nr:YiiD C-terminal domain-containing protein [Pirellulales bacterium]
MVDSSDASDHLRQLQRTLHEQMPICRAMQFSPCSWEKRLLTMEMPLEPNRNHQYSAFAGSLSALCTITGWGVVFMLLRELGLQGNVVIRRSTIRYRRPVRSDEIRAKSRPLADDQVAYFFELLEGKGRSKIEVGVDIADDQGPLVSFEGSYVVQEYSQI